MNWYAITLVLLVVVLVGLVIVAGAVFFWAKAHTAPNDTVSNTLDRPAAKG